jgi:hypothetical protein
MKRQSSTAPPQTKPLNAKDIAIIEGLSRYRYLLPEQVMRRYWQGKALSRAHAVLKNLTDQGYARAVVVPRTETRGKQAWAYALGPKGLTLLRDEGYDVPRRLHLSRQPRQQLPQTLCCNDVLIAAHVLSRYQGAVTLTKFIHEQDLHISPNRLIYPDGTKRNIEFDGVLFFEINDADGDFEQVLCLETDMGSTKRYWQEKLNAYIDYVTRHFTADYETDSFSLIVYTPTGETHLRNLIAWSEDVLAQRGLQASDWPSLLYFSCLRADSTDPATFFLSPTWRQPFRTAPASPIEVHPGDTP